MERGVDADQDVRADPRSFGIVMSERCVSASLGRGADTRQLAREADGVLRPSHGEAPPSNFETWRRVRLSLFLWSCELSNLAEVLGENRTIEDLDGTLEHFKASVRRLVLSKDEF
jgi:hypothetical protein